MQTVSHMLHKIQRDIRLPAVGLGTHQLHGREGYNALRSAFDLGYRHIDTARVYGNEDLVGQALADADMNRNDLFLTTKIWTDELTGARVPEAVQDSLRKLKTDFIDLVLIHWPGRDVPMEETLEALSLLRDRSRVRHIGVSNFSTEEMRRALRCAPVLCNQVEFHPFYGQSSLLALAGREDFFVTAYSPLARGRAARSPVLAEIGDKYGKSAGQVALRWLLEQPHVVAVPRSASRKRQRENLEVFDFQLAAEDVERINSLPKDRKQV